MTQGIITGKTIAANHRVIDISMTTQQTSTLTNLCKAITPVIIVVVAMTAAEVQAVNLVRISVVNYADLLILIEQRPQY
jgi:hypothetical protein